MLDDGLPAHLMRFANVLWNDGEREKDVGSWGCRVNIEERG